MAFFTIEYILTFLAGVSIGFAIGVSIILVKDREQKRLLNYMIDVYTQKEEEKLAIPKKGLSNEDKAKYLRAVLESIERSDEQIRRAKKKSQ